MHLAAAIAELQRRLATTAEERDEARERADWAEQRIRELEREVDQWVKNSAVAQRRIEALERQLAETHAALEDIARDCSSFPIWDGLAFRCESLARAALQNAKSPPG